MITRCCALTTMFLALTISGVSFGQGNFFWSNLELGQGAVASDFEIDLQQGSSTTLFMYFDHQGQNIAEGFDMDFSWSNPGVASFTAAETFNFDLSIQGIPFDIRWELFAGDAADVTPNTVDGFLAVSLSDGIDANNNGDFILDEGYDATNDSFLIGSITFDATALGTTQFQIDNALIINGGMSVPSSFSNLTVNVVPEPSTTTFLVLATILATGCR